MAQKRRKRRLWDDDEKRRIVGQTRVPGISVSQVARRYDVNANLVFKWLRDPRFKSPEEEASSFLPVEVIAEAAPALIDVAPSDTKIEIALANGHRVSISGAFDVEAISHLVRGLNR
jgi:transposase